MRTPFFAGNWKMNLDRGTAIELVTSLRARFGRTEDRHVAVVPPFVYLADVVKVLIGSNVRVGAQNMCEEPSGAFTGEISGAMLRDIGCSFVLLGHSERRHVYGETDDMVNAKVHAALAVGLEVVLCIGETLEEREAKQTESVVRRHVTEGLAGVAEEDMGSVTLAYEPVWAIGTGRVATPEQAGEVHNYVRGVLAGLYSEKVAEALRIQYGGSVKPDNVKELMAVPGVDGALVGGASLDADSFAAICDYDN